MPVKSAQLQVRTEGYADVKDITPEVGDRLARSGLRDGIVTVFVPGSTGALTTMEYEPGSIRDLKAFVERLVPRDAEYAHNLTWGDGNGFSHLRASVLGPSLTVPFREGKLLLGTWQQIVFLDFDNRPRRRKLLLQMVGE
jgi:secondary thiamine-phosphate synthase enzyme